MVARQMADPCRSRSKAMAWEDVSGALQSHEPSSNCYPCGMRKTALRARGAGGCPKDSQLARDESKFIDSESPLSGILVDL